MFVSENSDRRTVEFNTDGESFAITGPTRVGAQKSDNLAHTFKQDGSEEAKLVHLSNETGRPASELKPLIGMLKTLDVDRVHVNEKGEMKVLRRGDPEGSEPRSLEHEVIKHLADGRGNQETLIAGLPIFKGKNKGENEKSEKNNFAEHARHGGKLSDSARAMNRIARQFDSDNPPSAKAREIIIENFKGMHLEFQKSIKQFEEQNDEDFEKFKKTLIETTEIKIKKKINEKYLELKSIQNKINLAVEPKQKQALQASLAKLRSEIGSLIQTKISSTVDPKQKQDLQTASALTEAHIDLLSIELSSTSPKGEFLQSNSFVPATPQKMSAEIAYFRGILQLPLGATA
jgi:hypothetical protein